MNITDVDDKIIKRARQNHLYQEYLDKKPQLEKVIDNCNEVLKKFQVTVSETTDPDKKQMQVRKPLNFDILRGDTFAFFLY